MARQANLTTGAIQQIRSGLKDAQATRRNSGASRRGATGGQSVVRSPNMQWLRVTSLTTTDLGGPRYPALLLTRFDGTLFADLDGTTQVWLSFPNGFSPAQDDVYNGSPFLARQDAAAGDGRSAFVCDEAGQTATATDLTPITGGFSLSATPTAIGTVTSLVSGAITAVSAGVSIDTGTFSPADDTLLRLEIVDGAGLTFGWQDFLYYIASLGALPGSPAAFEVGVSALIPALGGSQVQLTARAYSIAGTVSVRLLGGYVSVLQLPL